MPDAATFLTHASRPAKGIVVLGLLCGWLASPAVAEPRLLWLAPVAQLGDMAVAPLALKPRDWVWLPVVGASLAAVVSQDLALRGLMGGGRSDLDQSMPVFSELGEGWVLASGAALAWGVGALAGSDKAQEAGAVALQAMAVSGLMTAGLKMAFGSVRPSTLATEHRFFDYGRAYGELSFPSGHSFSAFAAAEAFGAYYGRTLTYPVAALIAYSRVYEGVHWPSDVAFGALCGIVTARFSLAAAREQGPPTLLWAASPRPGGAQLSLSTRY